MNGRTMTDTAVLRTQYGDDARLAARQALWRLRSGPPLYETVLDLADLRGQEVVVDVGCGNGAYLAELRRRGHHGPVLGLDLAEGMARSSSVHAATAVADAQALPLRDARADVALSLHMLYHVPDLARALGELRRIVRPGGAALIATNGLGHTGEAKALLAEAARRVAGIDVDLDWDNRRFPPGVARGLLSRVFDQVDTHEMGDPCPVRDPAVLSRYVATWPPESIGLPDGPTWHAVLAAVDELIADHFAGRCEFIVTSRVAVLACR